MAERQNILFVIIDQLRADCLRGALESHVDLPNLRGLESEAVRFDRHFSVTNPCGPSRASILTGQYAMNHRATRNGTPLPSDKPNLATEIRKAGYLPLLFGYTDSTPDPRDYHASDPQLKSYEQVMPGFVEACEMRLEESWPWRADLLAKGYDVPPYPDIFRPDGDRVDDPALYKAEDSDTAFLANRVIDELRARPTGWFAHVTFIRPHPPLVAPAPYNRLVDPATLPAPEGTRDRTAEAAAHPFNAPLLAAKSLASNVEGFPDLEETPENIAKLRAIYLGLAAEVDHHVGRIFDFLKETGQWDNTLVVVTADHGEMLGDHHAWGKMTYYDAAYHVPLMIRDPRHRDGFGTTVGLPTESVDVTPTILDLAGVDVPDTMDGHSLRPFLDGRPPANWRQHSFSELDFGDPVNPTAWQRALGLPAEGANLAILRGARHTLVHFNSGLPQILFEHEKSGEARNISSKPEAQSILLEMSRDMLDHRMRHAEGRFARTMVTPDGVVRAPRN
ncbi:sulfatase-like hydrolase/transferase [Mesobacterium sp. TK19101]|uniref:Sulfatase-like hydrolase/transferase n=1 Tax=Mesobacterium hydrothermale TaxID=3111907 RepID=A0ABU6HIK5_9RHOB|nr:sulfatase-like hydrolase/transferase [Mesobacterium sp. TK19101]MEC3862166.1 sulfatase-like hydrolase/transferase [Mesobacterium sp. TK19101]